ncbi:MAG: hypothetical protein ACP5NA_04555 [Candidatus Acidulodesulfobacterium sp.]
MKKEKVTPKRDNLNNLIDCSNNNNDNNTVISSDDRLCGSPLTIKETLIWLEESKIFFYKIKKSMLKK